MGDPERYRKPEEIKKWQEHDPIGIYRNHLISQNTEVKSPIASEAELDGIDESVNVEVDAAVKFAENSLEPPAEALFENVYVEKTNG